MILWLVGMMGSGKTTAGRLAADSLGIAFLDIDDLIESEQVRSIADIFETEGEAGFRHLETRAIARVAGSSKQDAIVATGGGSVLNSASVELMRSTGRVVWLDGPAADLSERIGSDDRRPLVVGSSNRAVTLEQLADDRLPLYRDAADVRVDTGGLDLQNVALVIEEQWKTS